MSFNVLFLAHAPDADWHRHQTLIDTGQCCFFTVILRDQAEALEGARTWHEKHRIDSILLCPGFTHQDAAEIFQALSGQVGVAVARGDGPSSQISNNARLAAINDD